MNGGAKPAPDLLVPPDGPAVAAALSAFATRAAEAFGERLVALRLFGSRANGRNRPDSDADIAVILSGEDDADYADWKIVADLASDVLCEFGLEIQPWPFSASQWRGTDRASRFAEVLGEAKRTSVPLGMAR